MYAYNVKKNVWKILDESRKREYEIFFRGLHILVVPTKSVKKF